MPEFIKEILSDTTINKIEFENSVLNIYLTFYTEEKYLVCFSEVLGYKVIPGWALSEGIESVEISSDSTFLKETIEVAIADGERAEDLKGIQIYSFIQGNVPVVQVVAKSYILKMT